MPPPYPTPRSESHPGPGGEAHHDGRLRPFELPAELAEFLTGQEYAMVMNQTNQGTVFVVKVPSQEIRSLAGRVPMEVRHELYQHDAAPVIRTIVLVHDQPGHALAMETFTNVADDIQWGEYAELCLREEFDFLFYDESLHHRLTKRVPNTAGEHMANLLNWADHLTASIPPDVYDFEAAKAAVIAATVL
jgi:hypothetical protein